MPNNARILLSACLGLAALLATGCAGLQPAQPRTASTDSPGERAAALSQQGDHTAAAEAYRLAANQASDPARSRLLLRSAESAIRVENGVWAREMLSALDPEAIPASERKRLQIAEMQARIAGLSPAEALASLPPPEDGQSPEMAARILALRADLLFANNQPAQAVAALVQRDVWLRSGEALRANDERIWSELVAHPPEARAAEQTEDEVVLGWLDLARLSHRSWPNRESFERALAGWERRYRNHPAGRHVLSEKLDYGEAQRAQAGAAGGAVALLVPLSGDLATAGRAVHDGFMAGYYRSSAPRPEVFIYDSRDVSNVQAVLTRAQADGVGFIVGPLRKDLVTDMVSLADPGITVLALNYSDSPASGFNGVYQFGLAPEDEARAVARRALAQGKRQAIVMVPQGVWGSRVYQAFAEELRAGGGEVFDKAVYNPDDRDFSESIKRILRYGAATAGSRQTDFAFVAAKPGQARQIRTQLRYYRASHLTVYSTSHAYAGSDEPRLDRDLNGMVFADMPWMLENKGSIAAQRQNIDSQWPRSSAVLPRLVALGQDAWSLSTQIRNQGLFPGQRVDGVTGTLHIDNFSRIHREPAWGRFVGGIAEPVPPLAQDTAIGDADKGTADAP